MKHIGELISSAVESDRLFDREFSFFNQMGRIDKNVAEKNRELITENNNLRCEIERLKKINFIDAMTGIYNKKYLKIRLGEEFAKARRYGSPLSSIFIDLDDFKAVNDTYGHIAGDKLLKSVSASLGASTINNGDIEYVSDPEELICMADKAMYTVKQNGKNNTCHLPFSSTSFNSIGKNLPVGNYDFKIKSNIFRRCKSSG
ncbi:MAG: hypothetical protein DRH26_11110 [Deltaproteobacteria bacterium]|nr:MAG: hypothetical protein DRH26_11110 [Deltaproteobacteria bacterium]